MRVNFQMTDLCRATTCLSIIVLDSHRNFIDVLISVPRAVASANNSIRRPTHTLATARGTEIRTPPQCPPRGLINGKPLMIYWSVARGESGDETIRWDRLFSKLK